MALSALLPLQQIMSITLYGMSLSLLLVVVSSSVLLLNTNNHHNNIIISTSTSTRTSISNSFYANAYVPIVPFRRTISGTASSGTDRSRIRPMTPGGPHPTLHTTFLDVDNKHPSLSSSQPLLLSSLTLPSSSRPSSTSCALSPSSRVFPTTSARTTARTTTARTRTSSTALFAVIPTLDNWRISRQGRVTGVVTNHPSPEIEDGEFLTTSAIKEEFRVVGSVDEGDIVITASGSKYRLGKVKGNTNTKNKNNNQNVNNKRMMTMMNGKVKPNANVKSNAKSNAKSNNNNTIDKAKVKASVTSIPIASPASKSTSKSTSPSTSTSTSTSPMQDLAQLRELKIKYNLSTKTLANGKYLLCNNPTRSTSGKSQIYRAYKSDPNNPGIPLTSTPLTIKISPNYDALTREEYNYDKITTGLFPGRFVTKYDFLDDLATSSYPPSKAFANQYALVIEAGTRDLKSVLSQRNNRGLTGRALRDAASAAAQCLQAAHSSNMVWTDLKTENFIVMGNDIGDDGGLPNVRGIDLESGMTRGTNPVDFSPEACPPEFASAFISGSALNFILDTSYDIWSYGMLLYELATGRAYFGSKTPAQITKTLALYDDSFSPNLEGIDDDKLKDLIRSCLNGDPKKRPGYAQILLHPYFITTGFGPFGFAD